MCQSAAGVMCLSPSTCEGFIPELAIGCRPRCLQLRVSVGTWTCGTALPCYARLTCFNLRKQMMGRECLVAMAKHSSFTIIGRKLLGHGTSLPFACSYIPKSPVTA
jgi:hypothetical protein